MSVRASKKVPANGVKSTNGTAKVPVDLDNAGTDLSRWRLRDERGRQTWHYLATEKEVEAWPITTADKYHLGLETVRRSNYDSLSPSHCRVADSN